MPRRYLNIEAVDNALSELGISQAKVASLLSVSREAVSKWLSGKSTPRPDKLLDLAILIGLDVEGISYSEMDSSEPVIAFRKRGASKITDEFVAHAKHMGRLLEPLTIYLPFDQLVAPVRLKDPSCDFDYLEATSVTVRKKLRIGQETPIDFPDLVGLFREFQAVLVPVMWGEKKNHRNALHIYLPESTTTWVFLNLDSNVFDFLFWMTHELGHVLTPDLRDTPAEDFADNFAGAILFPTAMCKQLHNELRRKRNKSSQLSSIVNWAAEIGISPITIERRINAYADRIDEPGFDFGNSIYAVATRLNQEYYTVRESIFGEEPPKADDYIRTCEEIFDTPFFGALGAHLSGSDVESSYVQTILDIPLSDAKSIRAELC